MITRCNPIRISLHRQTEHLLLLAVVLFISWSAFISVASADEPFALEFDQAFGRRIPGHFDGPIHQASFKQPQGIDLFTDGTILVADTLNHCIRLINDSHTEVSTAAGECTQAGNSLSTPLETRFFYPTDVAAAWDLYRYFVLDSGNNRILEIDGESVREVRLTSGETEENEETGEIEEFVFSLQEPIGIEVDRQGYLYIADSGHHRILRRHPNSGVTEVVAGTGVAGYDYDQRTANLARLNRPIDIATYPSTSTTSALYVADSLNGLIRRLRPGDQVPWIISNYAGSDNQQVWRETDGAAALLHMHRPYRLAQNAASYLFISLPIQRRVVGVTPMQKAVILLDETSGVGSEDDAEELRSPTALACDYEGYLWLFDSSRLKRYRITTGEAP